MQALFSRRAALHGGLALAVVGCAKASESAPPEAERGAGDRPASEAAEALIAAARRQIGVTLSYDPAYSAIAYPGGDVPRDRGVCTDVVIRAYRDAFDLDLQRAVHEDMARAFAAYPRNWGLRRPDRNIDHRRVPNLARFWTRAGAELDLPANLAGWAPGDVFSSLIGGKLPHTGIVSDRLSAQGGPLVIHNIGGGAREEELSRAGALIGRYRWRV